MRDDGRLHAGEIQVQSKLQRAVAFGTTVEPSDPLSNQSELRRILQAHCGRNRLLRRSFRKLSVRRRFLAWTMNNAGFGAALVGSDLPSFSRSRHEHRSRPRAQFPVLLERVRDRAGATNHLNAVDRILVSLPGRRQFGDNLRPIGIQFISQDHR